MLQPEQSGYSVLVTGGAGFIGSHVAAQCIRLGHKVTVLDNLATGRRENVPQAARFIEGSVTDPTIVMRCWDEGKIDFIYHFAGFAAESLSHHTRYLNYHTNVLGSAVMINAAVSQKVECFVFASSVAVYGHMLGELSEERPPIPIDPYGIGKYAVELDLAAAFRKFGLGHVVLRLHNVYGERQNLDDRFRNVVGIFMRQILRGDPLTVFGDGRQVRSFTCIDDVADLIARCPEMKLARQRAINLGTACYHSVLEVADEIASALGRPYTVKFLPARDERIDCRVEHKLMHQIFGVPVVTPLRSGVRKMATWACTCVERGTRYPIELADGMPDHWRA